MPPGCFVYLHVALGIHTVVGSDLKFFSGDVFLSFQLLIWVSERDCHNANNTRGCPYMFVILRVKVVASHGDFCLVAVLFCPAAGTCTSRCLLSLGVVLDSSQHTVDHGPRVRGSMRSSISQPTNINVTMILTH